MIPFNPALALKVLKSPYTWLALVLAFSAVQTSRLSSAKHEVETVRYQLAGQTMLTQQAVAANRVTNETVDSLRAQIQRMVDERELDKQKQALALMESERARDAAARAAIEERRRRDELWRSTQSCRGMGELRVDTACADIAARLRQRTSGRDADADS